MQGCHQERRPGSGDRTLATSEAALLLVNGLRRAVHCGLSDRRCRVRGFGIPSGTETVDGGPVWGSDDHRDAGRIETNYTLLYAGIDAWIHHSVEQYCVHLHSR